MSIGGLDLMQVTRSYRESGTFNICNNFHALTPLQSSDNSYRQAKVFNGSSGSQVDAVRGLQVCRTSAGNNRLKGVRVITGSVFDAAYSPVSAGITLTANVNSGTDDYSASQPNCNGNWQETVYCPSRTIATGVAIHHTADEIVGLALRCRGVSQ